MESIVIIIVMWFVCMIFYRPNIKFFLLWMGVCIALSYIFTVFFLVWGFLVYCFVGGSDVDESTSSSKGTSRNSSYSDFNTKSSRNASGYQGSSYSPGGDVSYYSNGNSAVDYGNVRYFSNNVRSVKEGKVTYYFDDNTGASLGRSVDNGNGTSTVFDDNGREIGHSVQNGNVTDYLGKHFQF